jgi:hypothetical protein
MPDIALSSTIAEAPGSAIPAWTPRSASAPAPQDGAPPRRTAERGLPVSQDQFERRPDERAKAYEAAHLYFEMRVDRSLAAVAKKLDKELSQMKRWSGKYEWVKRAVAFDLQADALTRQAMLEAAGQQAERWRERDEKVRERMYQLGLEGLAKSEKMMDFPLADVVSRVRKTGPDGRITENVTIIKAPKWTFDTAGRLATIAIATGEDAIDDGLGRPRRSQRRRR